MDIKRLAPTSLLTSVHGQGVKRGWGLPFAGKSATRKSLTQLDSRNSNFRVDASFPAQLHSACLGATLTSPHLTATLGTVQAAQRVQALCFLVHCSVSFCQYLQ